MSDRVAGLMLVVESPKAVGSPGVKPAAMLTLFILRQEQEIDFGSLVNRECRRKRT
jgi:hypothetical protein